MTRPLLRPTPALLLLALSLVGRPAAAADAPAADPADVSAAQPVAAATDEVLTPEARAQVLDDLLEDLRDEAEACFETGREVKQGDRVTLAFTVDADGAVTDLEVEKSNVDDEAVHACLMELVAALHVPAGTTEELRVEHPFFARVPVTGGDPVVSAAIEERRDDIRACWDAAIAAGRRPEGELEISWNVSKSGVFEAIEIVSSEIDDPEVEQCIKDVYSDIVVEPRAQPIQQTMTWTFSTEDSRLAVYSKESKKWSASVAFGTSSGMTLLHPTAAVRKANTTVMSSLNVSGSWRLTDQISASGGIGASYELTTPNDQAGRRFWLSDANLGLSIPELYQEEATGIRFGGGASATLGLSPNARWHNRFGTLGLSLSASRGFLDQRLNVSMGVSGAGWFHRYTTAVGEPVDDDGVWLLIPRTGGPEDLGRVVAAAGSDNAFNAGVNLSVSWQITDRVGANAGFALGRVWMHTPPLDALSSPVTDIDGNPVVDCGGLCPVDSMSGNLGVSWRFKDRWNLGANLSTAGAVYAYRRIDPQNPDATELADDARYFRFPFWDPNLSGSSFSLMVSRTF